MAKVDISLKCAICIYKITSPSGNIYIGQTWDLYHRYKSGVSKRQRLLYRSYEKYGNEQHTLEILHRFYEVRQETLDFWEKFYIDWYMALGSTMLNIRSGGSNGKLSAETKKILGQRKKDWSKSNPGLGKKYLQNAIRSNIGRKHSEESNRVRSEKLSGRVRSPEHSRNISNAKKGKPSGRLGAKFSVIALSNIRQAAKLRTANNKPIVQMDLQGTEIKEWPSIKSAALALSLPTGTIGGCIRGYKSYLTCGGFKWKYKLENKEFK